MINSKKKLFTWLITSFIALSFMTLNACHESKEFHKSNKFKELKQKQDSQENRLRPGAIARLPKRIDEASGLCPSNINPYLYWTHNDSLDQARMFLINQKGALKQEHPLDDDLAQQAKKHQSSRVRNVDWEACTSSSYDQIDGSDLIYVADTGNNFQWRQDQKIYVWHESLNDQNHHQLKLINSYQLRFPNSNRPPLAYWSKQGRCRDIEAMFWREHELFLISKCIISGPAMLWRVPRENSLVNQTHHTLITPPILILEPITQLSIQPSQHPLLERVTDANFNSKLGLLAVLTYQSIWVYQVSGTAKKPKFQSFAKCKLNQVPRLVRQAEAISWMKTSVNKAELIVLTESRDVYSYVLDLHQKGCVYD